MISVDSSSDRHRETASLARARCEAGHGSKALAKNRRTASNIAVDCTSSPASCDVGTAFHRGRGNVDSPGGSGHEQAATGAGRSRVARHLAAIEAAWNAAWIATHEIGPAHPSTCILVGHAAPANFPFTGKVAIGPAIDRCIDHRRIGRGAISRTTVVAATGHGRGEQKEHDEPEQQAGDPGCIGRGNAMGADHMADDDTTITGRPALALLDQGSVSIGALDTFAPGTSSRISRYVMGISNNIHLLFDIDS